MMRIRVLLVPKRGVYLAIALICLIGGASLAVVYRYSRSIGEYDLRGRTVVTSSDASTDEGLEAMPVSVAEESSEAVLEPEVEETLVSARVEYDYDGSSLAAARMSRDYARSREIDLLREALDRQNLSGQAAEDTQRRLLDLVSRIEAESSAESLIKARGFADAMVLVTDQTVEAIVACEGLDKDEVAVIGGILSRATGAKLHEIRISEHAEQI